VAGKDLRLAIKRKMIAVFADQHVGKQTRTCQSLCDRTLGCRHLMDGAAGAAAIFGAAYAQDPQASRNVVQHLADRFADLVDCTATAGADVTFDVEPHVLALKMVRHAQPADRCVHGCRSLAGRRGQAGLGTGDVSIKVFETQLQLITVEALGAPSELKTLQGLYEIAQPINLGLRMGALIIAHRDQVADHPMQRIDVIRQGREIDIHEPDSRPGSTTSRALSHR
jgi:hypothetical protein